MNLTTKPVDIAVVLFIAALCVNMAEYGRFFDGKVAVRNFDKDFELFIG